MSDELNPAEEGLVDCYRRLAAILSESREDLAPFEERNALKALAALWQVMNGLDQTPGHAYHLGA
jgi:hypothetical protein